MARPLLALPVALELVAVLASGLICGGWAERATAQGGFPGHGMVVPTERPLHVRLASAEIVAIATVASVEPGRLGMGDVRTIVGTVPSEFRVKRAGTSPPALGVGDRAILLLRGARSPYVFAERAEEITSLRDPLADRIWSGALAELHGVLDRPERLADLYARWLRGSEPALQLVAAQGLGDPEARFSIGPETAEALATASLDPSATPQLSSTAAVTALRSPAGATALLGAIPTAPQVSPRVLLIALRGMDQVDADTAETFALRALRDERPEIRRAATRPASALTGTAVREALRQLAKTDPDDNVRRAAERALGAG